MTVSDRSCAKSIENALVLCPDQTCTACCYDTPACIRMPEVCKYLQVVAEKHSAADGRCVQAFLRLDPTHLGQSAPTAGARCSKQTRGNQHDTTNSCYLLWCRYARRCLRSLCPFALQRKLAARRQMLCGVLPAQRQELT